MTRAERFAYLLNALDTYEHGYGPLGLKGDAEHAEVRAWVAEMLARSA